MSGGVVPDLLADCVSLAGPVLFSTTAPQEPQISHPEQGGHILATSLLPLPPDPGWGSVGVPVKAPIWTR